MPFVNNFDNASMYDLSENIMINIVNDKFNRKQRPKPISYFKPIPLPVKDLSEFQPARQEVRTENKYVKTPHKDYIPVYSNPYYSIKETGFNNVNHNDIFKKY